MTRSPGNEAPVVELTPTHVLRTSPSGVSSVCAVCGVESEVGLVDGKPVRRFRRPGGPWSAELLCLRSPEPALVVEAEREPSRMIFAAGGFMVAPEDEIIDGASLNATVPMVMLDVEFSPVLPLPGEHLPEGIYIGSESRFNLPVEVQLLEGGAYGLLPEDVGGTPTLHTPLGPLSAAVIARMRCRFILQKGAWMKKLYTLPNGEQQLIASAFGIGWLPAPGSALASALGIRPGVSHGRRAEPPPPVQSELEIPAGALLDGPHGKACDFWRVNDPASVDAENLTPGFKLCSEHWDRVKQAQGGRLRRFVHREYAGNRYR